MHLVNSEEKLVEVVRQCDGMSRSLDSIAKYMREFFGCMSTNLAEGNTIVTWIPYLVLKLIVSYLFVMSETKV